MSRTEAIGYGAGALAAAAIAAALALRTVDPHPGGSRFDIPVLAAVAAVALVAAVVIARATPGNRVAPVVALIGLLPAIDVASSTWADAGRDGAVGGAGWAALVYDSDWIPVFGALALLLLLFPDGRPLGPRWRWAVLLTLAAVPLALVAVALRDQPFEAPNARVPRPLPALPAAAADPLAVLAMGALLCALLLAAVAVVVRFRRSRGVERVQMKWMAAGAALLPAAMTAGIVEGVLAGTGPVTVAAFALAYLALTAAVVVAMVRHGLYDVDRVISRTIAWAALSLVLAALSVVVALVVADPLGGGSAAGAAAAAVAAAVAFDPLRRRLQRAVDRRFDRDRARAVDRVDAFAERLHDGRAAPEDIEPLLGEVLGDPGLRLLVWLPGAGGYASVEGVREEPAPGAGRLATAIGRGDAPLGVVLHDARLARRPGLVADVLRAAALPVEIARLHGELRGRLEEVRESRARLVRAEYEERRRLQRDLHDGAQQRLVALGMALRRVQRRVAGDREAHDALDGAVAEVGAAVRDLREIARGLRPGLLDDGLAPALADLARRTPLPVAVDVTTDDLPAEVGTTAYYVVSEALANVVKHAGASRVTVSARRDGGRLVVRVEDDGAGGAAAEPAGGLAGLADRVAAHGGRMALESPAGRGTRLEVVLPCG